MPTWTDKDGTAYELPEHGWVACKCGSPIIMPWSAEPKSKCKKCKGLGWVAAPAPDAK